MSRIALTAAVLLVAASALAEQQTVVVVTGAAGAPEYEQPFTEWSDRLEQAAKQAEAEYHAIGRGEQESSDKEQLAALLKKLPTKSTQPLWLVLIGHGTYNGKAAKFNLRGPDVSARELAEWLDPFERSLAVINCASASAPYINQLSAPNRVIVTATKSGNQYNFARFGDHFTRALVDPEADLDKDEQTSLLEAFLAATAGVTEFYADEGRLATEHSLIDDNGDGLGTRGSWFRGVRATRAAKDNAEVDGLRANQLCLVRSEREQSIPPEVRARRDELELNIERLRARKKQLSEAQYYQRLEPIVLELAKLYDSLDSPSEDASK